MIAFVAPLLLPLVVLTALGAQPAAQLQQHPGRKTAAAPAGNADNGKRLYASIGCAGCHSASAKDIGTAPKIAPPPLSFPGFVNYVRRPSGSMLPFSRAAVSDTQLADIYAFLESVSQSNAGTSATDALVGNAEKGKQLFVRDGCFECHGILGQGSNNYGPRLGPDPIPMQAIINYIRKPAGNMPPYTAKLVSDQDVADIYAYLKSVPRPVDLRNIPLFK
jgi:mono/diheme cytochrome c family protein